MAGPARPEVELDVEIRVNGQPVTGALVVGPDDLLVLNVGPGASQAQVDRLEADLRRHPALVGRVGIAGVESMAVVRAADVRRVSPDPAT